MKTILPRNISYEHDTIPIDFLGNLKMEYRQIPYISIGIVNSVFIYYSNLSNKIILYVLNIGIAVSLSLFKIENQNLEKLIYNFISYELAKLKLRRKMK